MFLCEKHRSCFLKLVYVSADRNVPPPLAPPPRPPFIAPPLFLCTLLPSLLRAMSRAPPPSCRRYARKEECGTGSVRCTLCLLARRTVLHGANCYNTLSSQGLAVLGLHAACSTYRELRDLTRHDSGPPGESWFVWVCLRLEHTKETANFLCCVTCAHPFLAVCLAIKQQQSGLKNAGIQ